MELGLKNTLHLLQQVLDHTLSTEKNASLDYVAKNPE